MGVVRWAGALGLLLVGVATALAAAVSHELWWSLPLTTAGLAAAYVAVGRGWLTRLPLAVGFTGTVGLALHPRPEGDYVVSSSGPGYLLLLSALLTLVVAIATLPRPQPRPQRPPGAPGADGAGEATYDGARDQPGA